MKAMILAAGRGERMKPLTNTCPKPLLTIAGKTLIEYHLIKLAQAGIKNIVINHAWLGNQIENYLKDGSQWGVNIQYSAEAEGALETAGGIINALPLLATDIENEPFLVINGDVFTNFDFFELPTLAQDCLAHLWLVENPEHNIKGDFLFDGSRIKNMSANLSEKSYTYSGIGLYHPSFFDSALSHNERKPLGPMLRAAAEQNKVSGCILKQTWNDVGTPERLALLNKNSN